MLPPMSTIFASCVHNMLSSVSIMFASCVHNMLSSVSIDFCLVCLQVVIACVFGLPPSPIYGSCPQSPYHLSRPLQLPSAYTPRAHNAQYLCSGARCSSIPVIYTELPQTSRNTWPLTVPILMPYVPPEGTGCVWTGTQQKVTQVCLNPESYETKRGALVSISAVGESYICMYLVPPPTSPGSSGNSPPVSLGVLSCPPEPFTCKAPKLLTSKVLEVPGGPTVQV